MPQLIDALLAVPGAKKTLRRAADFIDIQWTLIDQGLKAVAPRVGGKLLDVGCGNKPYLHIFAPHVSEYIGIEHEAAYAATDAASRETGPDLLYDGRRLPFPDAHFDTLLNIQVLEHTPDPQALLDEMARVLKRDGLLVLCAPFCFRLHEEPHDYFRYTPHGLAVMCERAGLEIVELQAHGGLWSVLGHKLNSYLGMKVARLDAVGQALGKLGHEAQSGRRARLWAAPVVLPAMGVVSAGARVLDRLLPDETEALSFLALVRHSR
ncbi:MAG: methyltransferase domain-containing protein [Myxococcaceae bacterium]|nr:methyltransferase domain-containing protein [Myxococcaceae bacterium]